MGRRKILYRYSFLWILMGICMVLVCSVSYARYRSNLMTSSYWFTSFLTENIQIHGEVTEEASHLVQTGEWPQVPAAWSYTADQGSLKFSLANGTSQEEYCTRDQVVTIDLIAMLAIEDPEKLTVTLTVTDMPVSGESRQYTGVAKEIVVGSRYAAVYGEGWVYRFYDEEDNEVVVSLEGGALHYQNCTISVSGTTDASLLSVEFVARYTES